MSLIFQDIMITFAIVLFTEEEDSPAVVRDDWLRVNDTKSFWPSFARSKCQIEKLLTDVNIFPREEDGWELCPVRVLCKGIDDLITAKASAKTAEFTSDIELSGRSKRIIKPVQRYNFDGSSEDDEASNSINNRKRQKKQEKPALPFHPLPQAPAIYASSRVPVDLVKQSPSDFISPSKASPTLNTNENNNFNSTHDQRTSDDAILRKLHYIQTSVDSLARMVEVLSKKVDSISGFIISVAEAPKDLSAGVSSNPLALEELLPCRDNDSLVKVNDQLIDSNEARVKLVRILSNVGGKTTKDKLFGMMKRIMNDDVAILYSFKGQSHSKKSFEDLKFLKLMTILQDQKAPDATDVYIKDVVADWLIQAKTRRSRKLSRALKKTENVIQGDENAHSQNPVDCNPGIQNPQNEEILSAVHSGLDIASVMLTSL
ncbi:uncharacterized protein [Bemisia tabaci]|uniref:uncharacterized protein isoform X1 n=2 Tax=Bemisia tabaci TaxID=7038 RepID=UPI003B281346